VSCTVLGEKIGLKKCSSGYRYQKEKNNNKSIKKSPSECTCSSTLMGTLKLDLAAFSASLSARDLIRMLSRLEGFFCFGIFPASIQVHFKMRLGGGWIKVQAIFNKFAKDTEGTAFCTLVVEVSRIPGRNGSVSACFLSLLP
jgi:hypothetical protein